MLLSNRSAIFHGSGGCHAIRGCATRGQRGDGYLAFFFFHIAFAALRATLERSSGDIVSRRALPPFFPILLMYALMFMGPSLP